MADFHITVESMWSEKGKFKILKKAKGQTPTASKVKLRRKLIHGSATTWLSNTLLLTHLPHHNCFPFTHPSDCCQLLVSFYYDFYIMLLYFLTLDYYSLFKSD